MRSGYLSDESTRKRQVCSWVCCLGVVLALLALLGLGLGLWKAFGSKRKSIKNEEGEHSPNDATAIANNETSSASPAAPSEDQPKTTDTTANLSSTEKPAEGSPAKPDSSAVFGSSAAAPGPIVDTSVCSPTFFRWKGKCIRCADDSPWNGTDCVHPIPGANKTQDQNSTGTVTSSDGTSSVSAFDEASKHKDYV